MIFVSIKPHKKQVILHCEMPLAFLSFAANDRLDRGSGARKSEDPSDQTLAFFERAAPPSPLQAGAPAWVTPGRLRRPLHHQGPRSAGSRGVRRRVLKRGPRSGPGVTHAGGPRSEGALGERNVKRICQGLIEGSLAIWLFARQRDARKDFYHRRIILAAKPRSRGLHEHLVRGAGQRQRKFGRPCGVEHQP